MLDGQKPQLRSTVTLFTQVSELTSFSVLLCPTAQANRLSVGNLKGIYIPLHSQACQRKQCYSKDSGDTSAYFTECLALDALRSL